MFPDLSHSALEKALNVDVDLTNCNLFCKFVPNRMNCLVTNILYLIQTPETDFPFPSILQSRRIRIPSLSCILLSLDQPSHLGARLCDSFTGNRRSSGSRWRKLILLMSQCNWPTGGWWWWRGSEGICRSVFVGLDAFLSLVPGSKQLPGRCSSANGEKVAQSGSTASVRRWTG